MPAAISGFILNKLALAAFVLVVLAVGAVLGTRMIGKDQVQPIPEALVEYLLWEPQQIASFTLQDFDKQEFDIDHFKGKWTFLFFGYTFCPDVCPVTMSNLASVFKKLEGKPVPMSNIQGVFISVDPERDTPDILKQYVPYFDSRFIGASGTKQQLDAFTRQIGALYYIDAEESGENYLVSHNSSLFLIDPKARLYARFTMPHDPEQITGAFIQIVQHYTAVEGAKTSWF